ncbi:MAG: hypothetical protein AABW59_00330 [archaeon]
MQRKSPLRTLAKRLIAPVNVIERAKNIRKISNVRGAIGSIPQNGRVFLLTKSGKKVSGRYRGFVGGDLFVERLEGGLVSININRIEKFRVKKS